MQERKEKEWNKKEKMERQMKEEMTRVADAGEKKEWNKKEKMERKMKEKMTREADEGEKRRGRRRRPDSR